jgi:exodeoxyribonuclease VII small subunit
MAEKPFQYKKALEEIEQIVQQIESGDADIDELSRQVKRAAELIKQCKTRLRETGNDLEKIISDLETN